MGNHQEIVFRPLTHSKLNCTIGPNNIINTWPQLLSTWPNQHMKRLWMAYHNKAIHQMLCTLQSNTQDYTSLWMHEGKTLHVKIQQCSLYVKTMSYTCAKMVTTMHMLPHHMYMHGPSKIEYPMCIWSPPMIANYHWTQPHQILSNS